MQVGLYGARCDKGGLGIQTKAWYDNMKPVKTLVISTGQYAEDLGLYERCVLVKATWKRGWPEIDDSDVRAFLHGLDVVVLIESTYNPNFFKIAKSMGVKTICIANYEWYEEWVRPDLIIAPSSWNFDRLPDPKIMITYPVDRSVCKFRLRERALTFLHIAGHQGGYWRNGTQELIRALPLIQASNIKILIYSQEVEPYKLPAIEDPRVEIRRLEVDNYADLYNEGDVLVYPRKYGGLSLQVNEALSCGLPVLMSDMEPQRQWGFPPHWLLPTRPEEFEMIKQSVEIRSVSPIDLADAIDKWAEKDIKLQSQIADGLAEDISWEHQWPKYEQALTKLFKPDTIEENDGGGEE